MATDSTPNGRSAEAADSAARQRCGLRVWATRLFRETTDAELDGMRRQFLGLGA
jgi:hypothetical protein